MKDVYVYYDISKIQLKRTSTFYSNHQCKIGTDHKRNLSSRKNRGSCNLATSTKTREQLRSLSNFGHSEMYMFITTYQKCDLIRAQEHIKERSTRTLIDAKNCISKMAKARSSNGGKPPNSEIKTRIRIPSM